EFLRKDLSKDDILDALSAAISGFLSKGKLKTIPANPERDVAGLPIEIVFFSVQSYTEVVPVLPVD
ncbi:hypothetical protein ACFL0O_05205, partial [Thermodesulfobacteriota bacterium]